MYSKFRDVQRQEGFCCTANCDKYFSLVLFIYEPLAHAWSVVAIYDMYEIRAAASLKMASPEDVKYST